MGAVCRPAGREEQWSTVPPASRKTDIGVDAIGGKRAVLLCHCSLPGRQETRRSLAFMYHTIKAAMAERNLVADKS
jgi:hypothetical protein